MIALGIVEWASVLDTMDEAMTAGFDAVPDIPPDPPDYLLTGPQIPAKGVGGQRKHYECVILRQRLSFLYTIRLFVVFVLVSVFLFPDSWFVILLLTLSFYFFIFYLFLFISRAQLALNSRSGWEMVKKFKNR